MKCAILHVISLWTRTWSSFYYSVGLCAVYFEVGLISRTVSMKFAIKWMEFIDGICKNLRFCMLFLCGLVHGHLSIVQLVCVRFILKLV